MRNRTFLIAGGAALAVLLLWYFLLYSPQSGDLDDARKREDAATATNDELELRLSRLQAAQAQEPELTAEVEELRIAIPDEPNLAQFILDANDAAQASGVQFLSISPTPPAVDTALGLSVIALSIDVTGGYFQTLDYLNRLADMPRIVVIDNLDLGTSGDGTTLTVAVAARMFTTAIDPAAAGTGATPTDPSATTTTTAPGATTTTTTGGAP